MRDASRRGHVVAGALLGATALLSVGCRAEDQPKAAAPPNILFVIMDDVGIDQMQAFGFGGDTPPRTPNIAAVADAGLRFGNTWAMPACSTSRAVIFNARFPLRTQVLGALGPDDLANSMVSPFELTVPKLLAERGYQNALFGKFHIALQGNDPAGYAMPHNLGWDYFAGWLDETGDPSSIDTTAGGMAEPGTWPCGFVPSAADGGADSGACYTADGVCRELSASGSLPPGRACRDAGGILAPGQTCQSPPPATLDFSLLSGHYVSPLVYNFPDGRVEQVPSTQPRARRFRAMVAVDEAVGWIKQQPANQPWMATVSFASDHTPLMQPPADLPSAAGDGVSSLNCSDSQDQRVLSNLMIESLDAEVGRLLVETGLATRDAEGQLSYAPDQTRTMVVILGDNGSLGSTVKEPFDVSRAKGTAYQTGVWVPLVVAGPLVREPDRAVSHMVNVADLYSLFGEIAGIPDVRAAVPRPIDAMPLLPYLQDPAQPAIRSWNYTEVGPNLQANGAVNAPCTISSSCSQIPVTASVCTDNNGVWWGPGATDPITAGIPKEGFTYCCEVNAFRAAQGQPLYSIPPLTAIAIRDEAYKLVENNWNNYVSPEQPCVNTTVTEFYAIDEAVPEPQLDRAGSELPLDALTPEQQARYDALTAELAALRASVAACPGDGNIDYVVDDKDLVDWARYAHNTSGSSVYDLDLDGHTNLADEAIIRANLGRDCRGNPAPTVEPTVAPTGAPSGAPATATGTPGQP